MRIRGAKESSPYRRQQIKSPNECERANVTYVSQSGSPTIRQSGSHSDSQLDRLSEARCFSCFRLALSHNQSYNEKGQPAAETRRSTVLVNPAMTPRCCTLLLLHVAAGARLIYNLSDPRQDTNIPTFHLPLL